MPCTGNLMRSMTAASSRGIIRLFIRRISASHATNPTRPLCASHRNRQSHFASGCQKRRGIASGFLPRRSGSMPAVPVLPQPCGGVSRTRTLQHLLTWRIVVHAAEAGGSRASHVVSEMAAGLRCRLPGSDAC